jgi:hypothetical protein
MKREGAPIALRQRVRWAAVGVALVALAIGINCRRHCG